MSYKTINRHVAVDGNAGSCFCLKGIFYIFATLMILMTVIIQGLDNNGQAKALLRNKLLQSPPSLTQLRHKRDTFANEHMQQARADAGGDYYDDNYDVLPEGSAGSSPPTVGDHISERAEQIAQSFKNMWQSLTDSVRHCIDALRAMFGDDAIEEEELTPEQEQQILAEMEEKYRLKQERDNEVIMNVYENNL